MSVAPDRAGRFPIHYAAVDDDSDLLRKLIDAGENVNAQEEQGWTPLHFAAYWGNLDIARILIDAGANIDATNQNGYTPLDLAVSSTKESAADVAKLLFLNGGDPHHKNARGNDTIGFLQMLDPGSPGKELLDFFREHGVE